MRVWLSSEVSITRIDVHSQLLIRSITLFMRKFWCETVNANLIYRYLKPVMIDYSCILVPFAVTSLHLVDGSRLGLSLAK